MRLLYVIGTRPEAIRSARMLNIAQADPEIDLLLLNTGQHYDPNMMGDFISDLGLPTPDFDLKVGSLSPAQQTAAIIDGVGQVLTTEEVDVVCVFGDTNSTLGGAIAAVKCGVPLVHVEAGGRSHDMGMPEEVNRKVVDHISGLLLSVCEFQKRMLESENVMGKIQIVGDPQHDVFEAQVAKLGSIEKRNQGIVTIHREENADDPERLGHILGELDRVSTEVGIEWIYPVHPRTRQRMPTPPASVKFVDPMGYEVLLKELFASRVCVTDSGGLQKEALWAHVPCVTARDRTEWLETIAQGANALAPASEPMADIILRQIKSADALDYSNPYGDGDCSARTIATVKQWVQSGDSRRWQLRTLEL